MNLNVRWVSRTCLSLILLGTPSLVFAQADQGSAVGAGSFQEYLDGAETPTAGTDSDYISLDVKDKDLGEVLKFVSRRVGVNVIADSNVKETVTVTFDRVEWRDALDVIAEQTHCKIVEVGERLIRFTQPPSISMEFQDADIKVVLDLLAKQAGANIIMSSDITGKVSLSLRDVPWRDALDTLVKTAGYVIVRADTASSNEILRVVRPDSLREQLETRHFQLRYVRPSEPYTAIISGISNLAQGPGAGAIGDSGESSLGGGGALEGEGGLTNSSFSLAEALREVISKDGGSLQYDAHTNTFIVKDTKPKLDEIATIIELVDVPQPQVYVEVKFIRTMNSDILERGIKFDDPNTPERDGFSISARGATPNEAVKLSDNLKNDPLAIFGGTYPFNIGRIDQPPFGIDNFQALGILDFSQTQALLRLVKDDERSRVVQEPSLTMVDDRSAVIFVGETIPFAVQEVKQDQNGNVTVAIDENERSPINVGFTLYLTPHVIPGTDEVNLSVIPKVSSLSGTTSTIQGFERFRFAEPGGQTEAYIDLPRETAQSVVTYLRVDDGHTAVIGGLQTEKRQEIETRVPLLSSIPILGNLFTWKRRQSNVESLLILITPHILKSREEEDHIYQRAIERHKKADYFYRQYEMEEDAPEARNVDRAGDGEALF